MLKIFKPNQGSVLVFSLIVLAILLSAALTVATVSVSDRKLIFSTDRSNQSFQVANSGVEMVLQQIYRSSPAHGTLTALATALGGGCSSGIITKNGVAGGTIKVSFYDSSDRLIVCTDGAWRRKVVSIKSEGTAFGTTRLVKTAVALGGLDCTESRVQAGVNAVGNLTSACNGERVATGCTTAAFPTGNRVCETRFTANGQCQAQNCSAPGAGERWTLIARCCK